MSKIHFDILSECRESAEKFSDMRFDELNRLNQHQMVENSYLLFQYYPSLK